MAIWVMAVTLGPIMGPALGGWLTENYNWRWVFYINVPFGILAFLGIATVMAETRDPAITLRLFRLHGAEHRHRRAAD